MRSAGLLLWPCSFDYSPSMSGLQSAFELPVLINLRIELRMKDKKGHKAVHQCEKEGVRQRCTLGKLRSSMCSCFHVPIAHLSTCIASYTSLLCDLYSDSRAETWQESACCARVLVVSSNLPIAYLIPDHDCVEMQCSSNPAALIALLQLVAGCVLCAAASVAQHLFKASCPCSLRLWQTSDPFCATTPAGFEAAPCARSA